MLMEASGCPFLRPITLKVQVHKAGGCVCVWLAAVLGSMSTGQHGVFEYVDSM